MKQQTDHKHAGLLDTQNNVEEHHKQNSTLAEMEKIEGTPFTLIKQNNVWFMVMGDWRITNDTETREEQLEKLENEKWLIIMHVTIICIKKQLEMQNKNIKEKNI